MIILGDVVLRCPEKGREVRLNKDCKNCPKFKHWGTQGKNITITCKN